MKPVVWPENKNLGRFDLKIAMCAISMKFGTYNKSSMLIKNILIGTDNLDPILELMIINIVLEPKL